MDITEFQGCSSCYTED